MDKKDSPLGYSDVLFLAEEEIFKVLVITFQALYGTHEETKVMPC